MTVCYVWWSRFITFIDSEKIKLVEKFVCVGKIFDVKFNSIYVWYIYGLLHCQSVYEIIAFNSIICLCVPSPILWHMFYILSYIF